MMTLPTAAQDPDIVTFGIVDSLVADLTKGKKDFLKSEFTNLVNDFTTVKSSVFLGGDPLAAGQHLKDGKWHFGVFQGVEFARAQAKYPRLQPFMIATFKQPTLYALLIAKKGGNQTGFDDFKGKNVGVLDAREHCRLFAEKGAGGKADFFGKLSKSTNVEDTLDDVLLGKLDAAIVDNANFKVYKEIHPGRFEKLKVVMKSEYFPAPVIAYHSGALTEKTLNKLRDGMLRANKSEKGKEVMDTFRISSFATVPADYQQSLTSILKAYPK